MLKKLDKYCANLNNKTANIARFLDPRRSSSDASAETKRIIRNLLVTEYDYSPAQSNDNDSGGFNLFAATADSQDMSTDEVEDFSMMTLKADTSCKCPVAWWKQQTGDCLMIMGSSVASESAFSDSVTLSVPMARCYPMIIFL